jgi:hypothetical protein
MPQHYFDVRDEDHLTVDKEGCELPSMVCARQEAARSLAEMARDAVRSARYEGSENQRMAIEVRNEAGHVLQVIFTFEVATLPS